MGRCVDNLNKGSLRVTHLTPKSEPLYPDLCLTSNPHPGEGEVQTEDVERQGEGTHFALELTIKMLRILDTHKNAAYLFCSKQNKIFCFESWRQFSEERGIFSYVSS